MATACAVAIFLIEIIFLATFETAWLPLTLPNSLFAVLLRARRVPFEKDFERACCGVWLKSTHAHDNHAVNHGDLLPYLGHLLTHFLSHLLRNTEVFQEHVRAVSVRALHIRFNSSFWHACLLFYDDPTVRSAKSRMRGFWAVQDTLRFWSQILVRRHSPGSRPRLAVLRARKTSLRHHKRTKPRSSPWFCAVCDPTGNRTPISCVKGGRPNR